MTLHTATQLSMDCWTLCLAWGQPSLVLWGKSLPQQLPLTRLVMATGDASASCSWKLRPLPTVRPLPPACSLQAWLVGGSWAMLRPCGKAFRSPLAFILIKPYQFCLEFAWSWSPEPLLYSSYLQVRGAVLLQMAACRLKSFPATLSLSKQRGRP